MKSESSAGGPVTAVVSQYFFMPRSCVTVNQSLWERLCSLAEIADERFPGRGSWERGFAALGLILRPELVTTDYWCSPKNALSFARTGGEGVHFSFVTSGNEINEGTPIAITIPAGFDNPNFIVGESLFDFLCLGYHRGYVGLEQLPSKRLFEAYGSATWQPEGEADWWVGFGVNGHQRIVLDFLVAELELSPWQDLQAKFEQLQQRYFKLLDIPERGADRG